MARQAGTKQVYITMREPLYEAIATAAKQRCVSFTRETVDRLELSATEAATPGPEIEKLARLMAAAFKFGGDFASGSPRKPPEVWLKDPICYRAATTAVLNLLDAYQPNESRNNPAPRVTRR